MKHKFLSMVMALAMLLMLVPPVMAAPPTPGSFMRGEDMIDIGPELRAQESEYMKMLEAAAREAGVNTAMDFSLRATDAYTVGDKLMWLAMDTMDPMGKNFTGDIFATEYEVRAAEEYCEVWVQTDLNYYNPDGTVNLLHPDAKDPMYVTQEKIDFLADVCSNSIRPTDVTLFGDYLDRSGAHSYVDLLNSIFGTKLSYTDGKADRIVILVSNIRDDNFYDPINTSSFIAGFNWGTFNTWGDRNFITIDSKQWNDRVGNTGHPTRAYTFDSTVAHEMQHLIHADQDGNEETWINEGMSGFAEFVNGYWITDKLGDRTQWQQAPENSLTLWGDQPGEILADYQLVNAFFLYLTGHLDGTYADTASLTSNPEQGILSINKMLKDKGYDLTFEDVFHNFRRDMLYGGYTNDPQPVELWNADFVDAYVSPVEKAGGPSTAEQYLGELRDNLGSQGYDTQGIPPFGTDFIELGWSEAISNATSWDVKFEGDGTPPETFWSVVDASEIFTPSGTVAGDVLYSDHFDLMDNFVVFGPVTAAEGDALTFDHFVNIEDAWDYGFVQVTTDTTGMLGWTSLDITGMMTETDDGAHGIIKANVPGFSGFSEGWISATYTLPASFVGQPMLVAFRYATDWATGGSNEDYALGWAIDNVMVGDQMLTDGSTHGYSIQEVRRAGPNFALEFLTWADGDGITVTHVYTPGSPVMSWTLVGDSPRATLDLAQIAAMDEGFDEAGERGVLMISSWLEVFPDLINGGMLPAYADYTLVDVPPSLLTSDVSIFAAGGGRFTLGQAFAGEVVTVATYLDNLGYAPENITTTGTVDVYAGVEVPPHTTYVEDSATNGAVYTDDLSTVAASFPAVPGLYWMDEVTRTAEFMAAFTVASDVDDGTLITRTVHYASDDTAAPDQAFVDTDTLGVLSGLGLSALGPGAKLFMPGSVVDFTFVGVNRSDFARAFTLVVDHPEDTTFLGVTGDVSRLRVSDIITGTTQVTITGEMLPYATNGTKDISFEWELGSTYAFGDMVEVDMVLTDEVTGDQFELSASAEINPSEYMYLPMILRGVSYGTIILP